MSRMVSVATVRGMENNEGTHCHSDRRRWDGEPASAMCPVGDTCNVYRGWVEVKKTRSCVLSSKYSQMHRFRAARVIRRPPGGLRAQGSGVPPSTVTSPAAVAVVNNKTQSGKTTAVLIPPASVNLFLPHFSSPYMLSSHFNSCIAPRTSKRIGSNVGESRPKSIPVRLPPPQKLGACSSTP